MEAKELVRRYSMGERDFAGADLRGANRAKVRHGICREG